MRRQLLFALLALTTFAAARADELSGVVRSSDGQPLRAAHVYVYQALPKVGRSTVCPSCYRDCGKHVEVASDGRFRIAAVDPNLKFRLLAVASGREPQFSDWIGDAQPATFELKPRRAEDGEHVVCGNVIDPEGRPVVGAMVEPAGVHVGRSIGYGAIPGVDQLSITDSNGEFALRIPPMATSLDVRIRARSFAPIIHRDVKPLEPRTLRVTLGSAVMGKVMAGGQPVKGARVRIVQLYTYSNVFLGTDEIATDDQGRFILTGVGPGELYELDVLAEEAAPRALAKKLVETGGDLSSSDAGTIELPR